MPLTPSQVEEIRQICPGVFVPNTPEYDDASAPWSLWADRHPQIAVEPTSLSQLQALIEYLYTRSSIDFCIRNTGTGGSSAADVCVSMHGLKSFTWDPAEETVTVGAGLAWGEVDKLMEADTDGYGVVGARCTWVGVTGGALVGGLSWLSHEHGMISDPQNLLDAQVVLGDGRVVWAKEEEPDLMWALRGGGGNFGVVTALKLRARKTSPNIFGGVITIPYSSLAETSRAVAAMHRRPADPKVAMHVVNQGPGMGVPDQGARPDIAIMPIDMRGEAHARSPEGFGWVWELPGAKEVVAMETTLQGINALNDSFKSYQGTNMFWLSAPLISSIDDETLVRAWKWYEESYNFHPGFGVGSTVLLEFMQKNAFSSTPSPTSTAWPRRGHRHVMQLVLGCHPDSVLPKGNPAKDHIREIVMKQFAKAGSEIGREHHTGEYHAGFLHEWNDLRQVYGENYEKLKEVKKRFDPGNRFDKGLVDLVGA